MDKAAISLLTYLSRNTYSYFQDIMSDLNLDADSLSALLMAGTEMGIFENTFDDWRLKRQPTPEEIEKFITKFPKITDFSALDISLHWLEYYVDPLVFIEIKINEMIAAKTPPKPKTKPIPKDTEPSQNYAPEPKKYYFEYLNQQAGTHSAAQPQAKPQLHTQKTQNNSSSRRKRRRRTNKLTYNKQKNYEEGITKLKKLQDELRRLRRLQNSDTPGFNDFDRGAMK